MTIERAALIEITTSNLSSRADILVRGIFVTYYILRPVTHRTHHGDHAPSRTYRNHPNSEKGMPMEQ